MNEDIIDDFNNLPPLSNHELKDLGEQKVIRYEDLAGKSITDILPNSNDTAVLFVPIKNRNNGHWVSIVRNGKNIYYIDSTGFRPDKAIKNSYYHNKLPAPYLSEMLNKAVNNGFSVFFSEKPIQNPESDMCGYHVILMNQFFRNNPHASMSDLHKYYDKLKKNTDSKSHDETVVKLFKKANLTK